MDYEKNEGIYLNELLLFPDKMDGLHIWEAGIVLARYFYHSPEILQGKSVIDLGTGVGVLGITAAKYSKCKSITFSDYKKEILDNAISNVKKNKIYKDGTTIGMVFDWSDYAKLKQKYDVIIASDVIYAGTPFKDLALLMDKALNKGGEAYIMIPNERMYTPKFLEAVDEVGKFELTKIELEDPKYLVSPLKNEKEGFQHFAGLKELKFIVHKFVKVKE